MHIIFMIPDINECSLDGFCVNAECFNEVGNFSCGSCDPGFARVEGSNMFDPCCK